MCCFFSELPVCDLANMTNLYCHNNICLFPQYDYLNYNYDMEGTLQMIANKLSQISWRMIKERIYDIIGDVIRKWDPSNMNLELELYVPTDFMW